MILSTHTHANLQNNGSKIISLSNYSHFEGGNLDNTTAESNNSKLPDIELGISNKEPSVKSNLAPKNSDVFSFYNFQSATPNNNANESKLDKSNDHQFNGIYTTDRNSIQNNDFQITGTSPSILEIESNQSSTNLFSTTNNTQLFADAGKDRTVYEGTSVTLNGSNSTSKDNVILSYAWRQIPNPNITIASADTAIWSFVAPNVSTDTILTFELTVTDNKGITSTDDVNIIVRDGNNIRNEINMSNVEGAEQNIKSNLESKPKNLVIQTLIAKNPVAKGEKQIIKIDLFDGNSDDKINNGTIQGKIMDSSKKVIKKFSMDNNSVNVSLNIPKNAKVGNSVVSVNASAPGYISSNMDTNFRIQK